MDDLLLHACCGPCSSVAVPAWRERGATVVAWSCNPNIQPRAEARRRSESMRRFAAASELELVEEREPQEDGARWEAWRDGLAAATPDDRCAECLTLRLSAAARAAARLGVPRFGTTLSVSPYQRHDLIVAAGEAAAAEHGVAFCYLDLRGAFRSGYAESRRLGLYRQPYCGCAASKWEAWHDRALRKRAG